MTVIAYWHPNLVPGPLPEAGHRRAVQTTVRAS